MRLHISRLHGNIIEADLQRMFSAFGEVTSVLLIRDKLNNRSQGHAFIEMPVLKQAVQAVISLDNTDQKGKRVTISAVHYHPDPHST